MSKALQALHKGQNALLESPTGTGKTLALLTSALAWQARRIEEMAMQDPTLSPLQKEMPMKEGLADAEADLEDSVQQPKKKRGGRTSMPRIYFASRTHSQIAQVVDELRHCHPVYLDGDPEKGTAPLRMSLLAARKHLCVNHKVMNKVKNDSASVDEVRAQRITTCRATEAHTGTVFGSSARSFEGKDDVRTIMVL